MLGNVMNEKSEHISLANLTLDVAKCGWEWKMMQKETQKKKRFSISMQAKLWNHRMQVTVA